MNTHMTGTQIKAFTKRWLIERMRHDWQGTPTICTRCHAKYGPRADGQACPKHRKPNRWRMHLGRALRAAQTTRQKPIVRTPAWMLEQLEQIGREVKHDPRFADDTRFWKYHRLARRYRKIMRDLWALPRLPIAAMQAESRDLWGPLFTRNKNKLIAEVRKTQARTIQQGACTYTFFADAHYQNAPLFVDGGAA